jgi:cysteine sulfinate desulfinase/cysteine desulfurase-like protein
MALGRDEKTALSTVRFSFGRANTIDDVDYAVEKFYEIVSSFAKLAIK